MPRFVTCGPNEAIIVSGCCHSHPTIRAGGRVLVWPLFHQIQRISLNTMTLNIESPKVYSDEGVPVTVKGVAQVKIQGKDLEALRQASEMFLDKTEEEIMEVAKATLDGHQRSMIASMKIEDIYKSRHEFSKNVHQSASTELLEMGLTLISYTLQDISDDEGYLDALGQERTVAVRSEARKEIANAKTFSELKDLESEQAKEEKKVEYESTIAMKQLEFDISREKYLKDVFENKAKADKAGDLRLAEMNKLIAEEEFKTLLLEKQKENELMTKKRELRALELTDKIERKADFECEREKELALAYEEKTKAEATAEAEKIRELADARSEIIKLQREAEAQVLQERANAFLEFGDAAKLEMVLAILPRLTAEIAGPISDCKKITSVSQDGSVGFSRITNEILEVVEQVYGSVANITGQSLIQGDEARRGNTEGAGPSGQARSPTESIASRTGTSRYSTFGGRGLS